MNKKGRPKCLRLVECKPDYDFYKPRGVPLQELDSLTLKVEEFEAIRLVDYEKLEQKEAAEKMQVSRRTLARELKSGRQKIAEAIMKGMAIEIKGGDYATFEKLFLCKKCGFEWIHGPGKSKPAKCPECQADDITRKKQK